MSKHACIRSGMHARAPTHPHTHPHPHPHAHAHAQGPAPALARTHRYIHMIMLKHMYVDIYIYTQIYSCTRTHIHMSLYIYMRICKFLMQPCYDTCGLTDGGGLQQPEDMKGLSGSLELAHYPEKLHAHTMSRDHPWQDRMSNSKLRLLIC